VLETMFWPDEIRAADFDTIHESEKIREQEIEMAKTLIANLSEPWNPDAYHDEYREALLDVVEKKAAGEEIEAAPEAQPARVVDLMEALKASVEAVKKKGPSSGDGAAASPAKKSTAKRSNAKSSAKKTTAPRKKAAAG
jgi:DNA end-binding protein Ku